MQAAVLVVVLGFLVLFAGMTIEVISRSGFDVLTGLALFFIIVIAIPLIGGLLGTPPDDD
ncbi:MAG: hypothetical protein ACRDLQ_08945 [Solirubrobacterales bacterium]